jgi:hypothetical protein
MAVSPMFNAEESADLQVDGDPASDGDGLRQRRRSVTQHISARLDRPLVFWTGDGRGSTIAASAFAAGGEYHAAGGDL